MSVDPMVASTDQPYVFTNDNPLNSTDPLGLKGSPGTTCIDKTPAQCNAQVKKVIENLEKTSSSPLAMLNALSNAISSIPGLGKISKAAGFLSGILTIQIDAGKKVAYIVGDVVGGFVGGVAGGSVGAVVGGSRGAYTDTIACGDQPECAPVGLVVGGTLGAIFTGWAGAKVGISLAKRIARWIG